MATYGDRWWWQQDGARCHTSNFTQEFLQIETLAFFDRNSWLPYSPDCSLLDFAVFERLKGVPYKSKDQLKSALKNALAILARALSPSHMQFWPRLELVVENIGAHIE
uniref:Uncharacterized protein n=1 Tax=Lepeophtheirus salmonis TaxID=72036 RepID=A0A0K2V6Z4_LEPSM